MEIKEHEIYCAGARKCALAAAGVSLQLAQINQSYEVFEKEGFYDLMLDTFIGNSRNERVFEMDCCSALLMQIHFALENAFKAAAIKFNGKDRLSSLNGNKAHDLEVLAALLRNLIPANPVANNEFTPFYSSPTHLQFLRFITKFAFFGRYFQDRKGMLYDWAANAPRKIAERLQIMEAQGAEDYQLGSITQGVCGPVLRCAIHCLNQLAIEYQKSGMISVNPSQYLEAQSIAESKICLKIFHQVELRLGLVATQSPWDIDNLVVDGWRPS